MNCMLNKRKNKDYIPDDKTTIKHVDEILKFLSVMTGDSRYEEILSDKEGVSNMCDVAQRLEDRGIEKGINVGINQGVQKGIKEGICLGGNQMIYSLVQRIILIMNLIHLILEIYMVKVSLPAKLIYSLSVRVM